MATRYYEFWLTALERLVTEKGLTDREAMNERKEAWAEAYRHTPHGKPVELNAAVGRHGARVSRRPDATAWCSAVRGALRAAEETGWIRLF